jgi:hypothetical protein
LGVAAEVVDDGAAGVGRTTRVSRPINFLFVGYDNAGENLAGLYSLIAICEANEVTAQTRAVGLKQVGGGLEAKDAKTGPAQRGRAENYVKTGIPRRLRLRRRSGLTRPRAPRSPRGMT